MPVISVSKETSSAEHIQVADSFVPRAVCDEIVSAVDPAGLHDATIGGEVDKNVRNVLIHDASPVSLQLNTTLQRIVDELIEPYYGVQIDYWESPALLIYPPGGFFLPHNDDEDVVYDEERDTFSWRRSMDRDISVVWYLNQDFEGGELYFSKFDRWIRPATGMVVTFPSWHDYAHTAKPVSRGMRYAVTTWMAAVGTDRVRPTPPPRVLNRAWQQ